MLKRIAAFILTLILLLAPLSAVRAEENDPPDDPGREDLIEELDIEQFGVYAEVERDADLEPVSVNGYPVRKVLAGLNVRSAEEAYRFEIYFVDYPFYRTAAEYDGNLAVMSLAMALSANRARNLKDDPDEDFDPSLHLERYLSDAGFENIRKDDYSKETSMYTISTAMGARRMEQPGEEPFTLIAIGVCGGGYKNEWQSNMTPGDGPYHEGFLSAANLVIDRLAGYLMTNGIEGRVKVWISGFSRAAAVSNLVAGLLVRNGMLNNEDVYAYTFATPAAVLEPPETGYENIHNILNPMDLVPQVMPADWGFGRFGEDLFIPTTEFSSIGESFTAYRAAIAREQFGVEANYSPALNFRMRLLLSMVLDVAESREAYNARMQPAVVGLMRNKNASNLLSTARDLLLTMTGSDREGRRNLDELIDYVVRVFGNALTRTELDAANSNSGGAGLRLFNEHREDSYLANINLIRNGVFEDDLTFTYVLIRGPVRVTLTSSDVPDDRIVLTDTGEILSDRFVRHLTDADRADRLIFELPYYMERIGNTSILAVPNDADFLITWETVKSGTVEVRQATCSVFASARYAGVQSASVSVPVGATGVAFRSENGRSILPDGFTEAVFDANDLAKFAGIASIGVNWRIALMVLCAILGTVLTLLVFGVMHSWRSDKKLGVITWLCLGVFFISMIEIEAAFWFLADRVLYRLIWKAVMGAALVALYFRRRERGEPWKVSLFPGLFTAILADLLITVSFLGGAALFLVAHVFLILAFRFRKKMTKSRWVQWGIISAALVALIVVVFVPQKGLYAWAAAVYAPVVLLMRWAGGRQTTRVRFASLLFLLSDVLLAVYFAVLSEPVIHILYMILFYVALLIMAVGGAEEKRPEPLSDAEEPLPETEAEQPSPDEALPEAQPEKRRRARGKNRKKTKRRRAKAAKTAEPAE
ncbi:MAG: hypothetical protein II872_03750 [Clostridia bacterium]|nr:hypothetical protein [Clostridia bacterium]